MASLLLLRVQPNIYPTVEKNASLFFEKVLLKGTSPVDHSQQHHKTVLELKYFFFKIFEDLRYYYSSYTFLTALGELILIIIIGVEHVTYASTLLFA